MSSSLSAATLQSRENFLRRFPLLFRLVVVLFILLGALMFGGLLLFSVALALGVLALILSGKGLILLAKLAKVIWILFLPLWGFLRIGWRALTSRQPKPEGRPVSRAEVPALYEALDDMRRRMRGPKIDGVLLLPEMNAFAITRPLSGFWFVPWKQRFIGLGVPMIQTLSEQEALAVVAHEYGHLSGHPNRFDAFVYRLRYRLVEVWQHASSWEDWPSRMLARVLRWYIMRFDKWAFALCRASEYAADRASSELVGARPAAEALMRFQVANAYVADRFWGKIFAQVRQQESATQVRPWQQLPTLVREEHDEDVATDLLRSALNAETDMHDTHPALRDRLAALAFDVSPYRNRGQAIAPVATRNAAEAWLGDALPGILSDFEQQWVDRVGDWWEKEYQRQRENQIRKKELSARTTPLSDDEAWDLLLLRIEDDEIEDADASVRAFVDMHPDHPASLLAWGRHNLFDKTDEALVAIRQAMQRDPKCALEGAQALADYYARADDNYQAAVYALMVQRLQHKSEA